MLCSLCVCEKLREGTDFDADAFFFFGGRAGACAGAFVGRGGGYLGDVGLARHAESYANCGEESGMR